MKNKTIFVIKCDHAIDLITNSSSELFVLEGASKEIVQEMVSEQYPEYLTEYREVKSTAELTTDELDTYISYSERSFYWDRKMNYDYSLFGIPANKLWKDWDKKEKLEKNGGWWHPQLTDDGAKIVKETMDPENKMYFLFSLDENPKYEMQEKLETIATRYHLG